MTKTLVAKLRLITHLFIKKRYLKPEVSLTIDSHDPKLQKSVKIFP